LRFATCSDEVRNNERASQSGGEALQNIFFRPPLVTRLVAAFTLRLMGRSGDSLASKLDIGEAATANPPGDRPPGWLQRFATGLFAAVLAIYFGLVRLGQWQADEYDYFSRLREGAGQAFATRIRWSPRPLGELLYLVYGLVANRLRQPLTGWFLGLLWIGFLICACATAWGTGKSERRLSALLAGLALAAAFLTSGPLFQVFYWPAGAVAYLTTLAATLLLSLQIFYGRLSSSRGRWICGGCLLVAALSSEIGAILAVCFAGLQAAGLLFWRERRERAVTWWLLPGAAAVGVLLWAATHRLPVSESAFITTTTALHNPLQSAAVAGGQLVLEILGWSSGAKRASSAIVSLIARLALAAGVALLWPRPDHQSQSEPASHRHRLLMLGTAFLVACFASLFASYLHFGNAGGERYETLRRCWMVMAYVAVVTAFGAARLQSRQPRARQLAPALLLVGVLLPWHVSPLLREYAAYARVRQAIEQTFQSGYQQGSEQMVLVNPPPGGVITPAILAPRSYSRTSQAPEFNYAGYILTYFGKQVLVVPAAEPQRPKATAPPAP
jgi:hypothetical protein